MRSSHFAKSQTFTFSASPEFVAEVKNLIQEPFSRAVVKGLQLYLEDQGLGAGRRIRVRHCLGSLTETLEFHGVWIVNPESCISFGPVSQSEPTKSPTSWWAAGLTTTRCFIWFCGSDKEGLVRGEFDYRMQHQSELGQPTFWIVPTEVYDSIRRMAGSLMPALWLE